MNRAPVGLLKCGLDGTRVLEALVDERSEGKDVELLSFYGLDYPVEHGRGWVRRG